MECSKHIGLVLVPQLANTPRDLEQYLHSVIFFTSLSFYTLTLAGGSDIVSLVGVAPTFPHFRLALPFGATRSEGEALRPRLSVLLYPHSSLGV